MNGQEKEISKQKVRFSMEKDEIIVNRHEFHESQESNESSCVSGCKECLKGTFLCLICACIWNRR